MARHVKRRLQKHRKVSSSPRIRLFRRLVARGYSPRRALQIIHRYMRYGKFRRLLRWRHGYRVGTPSTYNQEGELFKTRR